MNLHNFMFFNLLNNKIILTNWGEKLEERKVTKRFLRMDFLSVLLLANLI